MLTLTCRQWQSGAIAVVPRIEVLVYQRVSMRLDSIARQTGPSISTVHSESSPWISKCLLSFRPLLIVGGVNFLALDIPIEQGAMMGYVRYVGRVGALAVALGVGSAVATMPGVALAEPSDSSSSSSSSSSGSSSSSASSSTDKESPSSPSSSSSSRHHLRKRTARRRRIRRRRLIRAPASCKARVAHRQARRDPRPTSYRKNRMTPVPLLRPPAQWPMI